MPGRSRQESSPCSADLFGGGVLPDDCRCDHLCGTPVSRPGTLVPGGGGYILYWRYQEASKAVNILRNGEAVIGQVTGAQINYSVAVNGRNPITVGYHFRAAGRDYQSTITTLNHLNLRFEPGKSVCVLYLPDAPEYSSLYPHP